MHPNDNLLIPKAPKQSPLSSLMLVLKKSAQGLRESALALLPIVLVIGFFQFVVLRQPIPNLGNILAGTLMVMTAKTD